jgi:hypothetical protein
VGLDGDRGFLGSKAGDFVDVAISGISLLRSFLKIGDGPLDEAAKPLVYFNRGGICWDQR